METALEENHYSTVAISNTRKEKNRIVLISTYLTVHNPLPSRLAIASALCGIGYWDVCRTRHGAGVKVASPKNRVFLTNNLLCTVHVLRRTLNDGTRGCTSSAPTQLWPYLWS